MARLHFVCGYVAFSRIWSTINQESGSSLNCKRSQRRYGPRREGATRRGAAPAARGRPHRAGEGSYLVESILRLFLLQAGSDSRWSVTSTCNGGRVGAPAVPVAGIRLSPVHRVPRRMSGRGRPAPRSMLPWSSKGMPVTERASFVEEADGEARLSRPVAGK